MRFVKDNYIDIMKCSVSETETNDKSFKEPRSKNLIPFLTRFTGTVTSITLLVNAYQLHTNYQITVWLHWERIN